MKDEIRHQVMIQAAQKFSIFRIRQKISYLAFKQRMTIAEIIVESIHKTYTLFQKKECLNIEPIPKSLIDYFKKVLEDGASHCIKGVVEINKIIRTCTCETTIAKKIGEKMIRHAEIL
jgi:hypothetical protein